MSMIFPAEPIAHRCVDVLEEAFDPRPAPGSIATCCGKYFVLDERTGLWKRLPKWSRRVREALAHYLTSDGREALCGVCWSGVPGKYRALVRAAQKELGYNPASARAQKAMQMAIAAAVGATR